MTSLVYRLNSTFTALILVLGLTAGCGYALHGVWIKLVKIDPSSTTLYVIGVVTICLALYSAWSVGKERPLSQLQAYTFAGGMGFLLALPDRPLIPQEITSVEWNVKFFFLATSLFLLVRSLTLAHSIIRVEWQLPAKTEPTPE